MSKVADFNEELVFEFIKNAMKSEGDGLYLVATNGIKDPTTVNEDGSTLIIQKNAMSVVVGLMNQALEMNDVPNILDLCDTLEKIAEATRYEVHLGIAQRSKNN
jgi:hypothetical protein